VAPSLLVLHEMKVASLHVDGAVTDIFFTFFEWRVGLLVSTSDSRFVVAGSSTGEGTTHHGVTTLSKLFTRTCSVKPSLAFLRVR
jgi:hypothetical protein